LENASQLGKRRHARESGNPVSDFIQIFEILDARFRGHDKLRRGLKGEAGRLARVRFKPSMRKSVLKTYGSYNFQAMKGRRNFP